MKANKFIAVLMTVTILLSSCSSFNYVNGTETSNTVKELTFEELLAENGITEDLRQAEGSAEAVPVEEEDASETVQTSDDPSSFEETVDSFSEENVDIDDTDQWMELEPAPIEEEPKGLEDAASPQTEQSEAETMSESVSDSTSDQGLSWTVAPIDMESITPVHMDPITPTFIDASWASAEDMTLPEPVVETVEENVTEPSSEPKYEESESVESVEPVSQDPSWSTFEEPEQIGTTGFIEGVEVASSWDMLSEYDRFVADSGYEIKEPEAVVTSSFVVADPVPVADTGFNPPEDFNAGYEEVYEAPLTLDDTQLDVQWQEVAIETPVEEVPASVEETMAIEEDEEQKSDDMEVEEDKEPEEAKVDTEFLNVFTQRMKGMWEKITEFFRMCWHHIMEFLSSIRVKITALLNKA